MNANAAIALTTSRTGRVLLLVFCLLRRPAHTRWHWDGILREFGAQAVIAAR